MKTILLLEDLPEIRAWLRALVVQVFPGSTVVESARVHDALQQVGAHRFDLAMIDLGLPDGSGVKVVQALREAQPDAQSVVVTIHDDDDHLFPALQAGAYGYLLKEQPREQLMEHLQRISQGEPPLSPPMEPDPARNSWTQCLPEPWNVSRKRSMATNGLRWTPTSLPITRVIHSTRLRTRCPTDLSRISWQCTTPSMRDGPKVWIRPSPSSSSRVSRIR